MRNEEESDVVRGIPPGQSASRFEAAGRRGEGVTRAVQQERLGDLVQYAELGSRIHSAGRGLSGLDPSVEGKLNMSLAEGSTPRTPAAQGILDAVKGGDPAAVSQAAKAAGDLEAKVDGLPGQKPGMTALMLAAQSGKGDVVESLLKAGAKPESKEAGKPAAKPVAKSVAKPVKSTRPARKKARR